MTTQTYLDGRKKYARPQGMMWSTQPPQVIDGKYVPYGLEINSSDAQASDSVKDQFLILSDDNRDSLKFNTVRLESRKE